MIEIKDLHANIQGSEILRGINLTVKAGEKPKIPKVKVVRKKKATKKKKPSTSSKAN